MIKTEEGQFIPCGFLKNGQIRPIYGNSLVGKIKRHHHVRGTNPKLMVCITMYNEDEDEFKTTMRGVMQNYEVLRQDPDVKMKTNDLLVVLCCDGFENIPQSFIDYLVERKALDLNLLQEKGFAAFDERSGRYKMRPIQDFMEPGLEQYPNNLLHCFGGRIGDFGLESSPEYEFFRGRKVNFLFALKHQNNGKVNSFKWLFQGLAQYLQPKYLQKLDIGTRPSDYGLAKLYKHMEAVPDCGGVCAEVVIDTDAPIANSSWGAWWVSHMQFYEYKQTIAFFKVFEGWAGFVQALPGCYSMYRYDAVKGWPLEQFFKLINSQQEPTCWEANEYLVEDRLLSNNVYYQSGRGYKTDFVVDAPGYTDAPHTLALLMKQRRRWTNGPLFGELTTFLNSANVLGFGGQTHSTIQRLKMMFFLPALIVNKCMGWISASILLTQMKYMLVYGAYSKVNQGDFKERHPDAYKFFVNDPSSMGFSSFITLAIFSLVMITLIPSVGCNINDAMPYYRVVLVILQVYTLCAQFGTYQVVRDNGIMLANGQLNLWTCQFVLGWIVLLCPVYLKPIDTIMNLKRHAIGLPAYYFSFLWWFVIISIYSICNIDDVTWGNRPANASKGLNTVIDDAKRQQILKESYRTTRTHILIAWLSINIALMYTFDALVLSAVHNNNVEVKATCQAILRGYATYNVINTLIIMSLSAIHHLNGHASQVVCGSKYTPATIYKRPPVSSDPETKVLLDDTDEDEVFTPPVAAFKKKGVPASRKSEDETDEDPSYFSDDPESRQFMQKYRKRGGWTY